MTPDDLRTECLAHIGTIEDFPFPRYPGRSTFKMMERGDPERPGRGRSGRVFAISSLDEEPLRVSVKCDPDESERLRSQYAAIVPGYRLNKRHWITVYLDGSVPDDLVESLVTDSYELVRKSIPASRRPE